ncbi:MAG TPA: LD-carboxypeptidase [Desulfobacterales bacterium]|nr:LD-carboxypeptidase [Desulfobacterales bacterium]
MNAAPLKTIIPPALRRGDHVALIAPSGPLNADINIGMQWLTDAGLRVVCAADIRRRHNYLAGVDSRRLQELHGCFSDTNIKAVMAVRGGFGSARLLPFVDFELIAENPKILLGFSDLTALLNAITFKTGLITWHGPMLSTIMRTGRPALDSSLVVLGSCRPSPLKVKGLEIIRPGQAAGRLMGGNLTTLVHLLATPYEPNWQQTILFIEDINEPPYRVDRLLTHLQQAGRLEQVAGVIVGGFLNSDLRTLADIELIWQRVLELTGEGVPVWANFPVSHGIDNVMLPVGASVLMDSGAGVLRFQEDCLT